jgi:hypothetical protein
VCAITTYTRINQNSTDAIPYFFYNFNGNKKTARGGTFYKPRPENNFLALQKKKKK